MAPQKLLDNLVAIVTGGGSGFGEGIAQLFAEEGAKVVILDINQEGGERVTNDIKNASFEATYIRTDVTKASDWNAAVEQVISKYGKIDILVNNAGWTYRRKDSLEVSEAEYDPSLPKITTRINNYANEEQYSGIFDINVKSIYHSVNATVPHFLKQGSGSIINISSCVTSKPTSGLLYYSATKGAVDLLTRGLAAEYSHRGLRVNGISPSLGQTALVSEFVGEHFTSDMAENQAKEMPVQRMVTPRDIAKGCLYYATPFFNDFQTGGMLRVDGGQYVRTRYFGSISSPRVLINETVLDRQWKPRHVSV